MSLDISLLKNWWWLTINGLAAILFGLVALWYSSTITLVLLMAYFGLLALFLGAFFMIGGYLNRLQTRLWDFWFFEGVLNASIGLILLFRNNVELSLFLVLLSLWAILVGSIQIISVLRMWGEVTDKLLYLTNGLWALIFGIFVLVNPLGSVEGLIIGIGVYTIIMGTLSILISFSMKKIISQGSEDQTRIYTYHH